MPKPKSISTKGLSCGGPGESFKKSIINRNALGDDDVELDIKFCGISHEDVHAVNNDLGTTVYPLIPGHEIAGVVTDVGDNVEAFEVGDTVGVGVIVETCGACNLCTTDDQQQFCPKKTLTYGDAIKHNLVHTNSGNTFGGYSKKITVHERFVVKIPEKLPLHVAAPLLCSGAAAYSALKHFGVAAGGKRIGVLGIGGLGQMAVKLAVAMGNQVTAISSTANKKKACKAMGAMHFVLSTDSGAMEDAAGSLDVLLDTSSAPHQCSDYMSLLAHNGTFVNLGTNTEVQKTDLGLLESRRLTVGGSRHAGHGETQECVDFCTVKGIAPKVEVVAGEEKLQKVFEKLSAKNDSVKRFVLDIAATF